jgi:hypothetical protein
MTVRQFGIVFARAIGLLVLSTAAGAGAWVVAKSSLESTWKLWPLVALCVVAAAGAVYDAYLGWRRREARRR